MFLAIGLCVGVVVAFMLDRDLGCQYLGATWLDQSGPGRLAAADDFRALAAVACANRLWE